MDMTFDSLVADVRALGAGAPVRAGYELSKRVGLHSLVFGRLVPTGRVPPRFTTLLGPPATVPPQAAARTLDHARQIVDGTVVVFGREIHVGEDPNWHLLLHDDGEWPVIPWWKIDIRSSTRLGDVKWTWELARHRHLVVLARAAHLAPGDVFLARIEAHVRSWIEQNPPEFGVNWYSNLEIALRAISWLQVLALVSDRLDPSVRAGMVRQLYHSGRHLATDLPYTLSTMRNNHTVGDGLGLFALGAAFGGDPAARRWRWLGDRLLMNQVARQLNPDGSSIEDSVSYHRFVLEMLAVRVMLGNPPPSLASGLMSGANYLMRLGASAPPYPQFGDWDEGRVLTSSGDPQDLLGTVRLAAALHGDGAPHVWREEHDEPAWYAGEGEAAHLDEPVTDGSRVGVLGRTAYGPFTVWLKGGSAKSHEHADLSSVSILFAGGWIVGDPGTGTYNGDASMRTYFRTSIAHDVLRLSGEDQLVPYRAFRWAHSAEGEEARPLRFETVTVMWSAHNAYRRLVERPRVARAVLVDDRSVTVGDFVEGSPQPYRLSLPLHPRLRWNQGSLVDDQGSRLRLDLPSDPVAMRGSTSPFDGWWSDTYGSAVPATRLECRGDTSAPVTWTIRTEDSPQTRVQEGAIIRAGVSLEVLFSDGGVEIRGASDGRTEHGFIRLPR
jgi:hypothetical protein